jgi:N-acetyl sugar amidotransferase
MPNGKICKRCVLDETAKEITFDVDGVCNFCHEYDSLASLSINRPDEIKEAELKAQIEKIKTRGKGKLYDCILGVSGGVDSTYLSLKAKEWGLRPLIVHFDNGWNSELAVKNIENIITKLGFDLQTYVIDWEEFRSLQIAFFKASVIDLEMLTDHFIFSALYNIAKKYKIPYILSGNNTSTESVLPTSWIYRNKKDGINIRNINNRFGSTKIRKLPLLTPIKKYFNEFFFNIKSIPLLDLLDYKKELVKKEIIEKLDWQDYGGKHYESIFTRFYQGHYLVKKFGIDKRKAHLSNLICSGQMSREEALIELKEEPYNLDLQVEDREYVRKKWGMSEEDFDKYFNAKPVPHEFYGTENDKKERMKFLVFRMVMYFPSRIYKMMT